MPTDKLRLRWSPAAKQDLREIWRYYSRIASAEVADELLRKLTAAGVKAAGRPLLWRPRDDVLVGLRAVLVHPYALFYRSTADEVEIVRILHQRRDLAAVLRESGNED